MRDLWRVYDGLIDALPEDLPVARCLCGLHWFAVESAGIGLSMSPGEGRAVLPQAGEYAGRPVRALAALSKAWDVHEAALGMAAINSVLNTPDAVSAAVGRSYKTLSDANIFDLLFDHIRGKKVTVIGHFPNLDPWRAVCDLTILERNPQAGDTPDPACEWVLPEQDVVVITATTLINKTLPRLLELCGQARVVLAGPTTPLTPRLFDFGIDMLAGTVVEDRSRVWTAIQEGGQHHLFLRGSRMVTFGRDDAVRG